MLRKGIILAGGLNTRLFPVTKVISKHLIPIYDKPLIYYPLSTLMLAGIRNILIISDKYNLPFYKKLFDNGEMFGLNIKYKIQKKPSGIAEALILGKDFLKNSPVALILGDNIFYGNKIISILKKYAKNYKRNTIFGYQISKPNQFGVVEFNKNMKVLSIEEKPMKPKSQFAVTGLYFYDKNAPKFASKLSPSLRNEIEITDLNNIYLKNKNLHLEIFGRGMSWLDCGTPELLLQAQSFVKLIQSRQSIQIACIEEIALNNKWITKKTLRKIVETYPTNKYTQYLKTILNKK